MNGVNKFRDVKFNNLKQLLYLNNHNNYNYEKYYNSLIRLLIIYMIQYMFGKEN